MPFAMKTQLLIAAASLLGESPTGLGYLPSGVSSETAAYLHRVAWETCPEWKQQKIVAIPRRPLQHT